LSGPAIAFSGIVLAGGESRRMGRPKALLPFAGEILIVRVLKRLSVVTDEQVVVAAPGQDLPDLPAFVTSCDSPFLSLDLVRWMLAESAGWDVVVPEWEGRLNPLHAVYATALAGTYRRLLDAGRSRPVDAYPEARVRVVREEEIRRLDPLGRSLTNMNSPEEYERALAEAARESA